MESDVTGVKKTKKNPDASSHTFKVSSLSLYGLNPAHHSFLFYADDFIVLQCLRIQLLVRHVLFSFLSLNAAHDWINGSGLVHSGLKASPRLLEDFLTSGWPPQPLLLF